jgi:hypothetical protein
VLEFYCPFNYLQKKTAKACNNNWSTKVAEIEERKEESCLSIAIDLSQQFWIKLYAYCHSETKANKTSYLLITETFLVFNTASLF